MSSEIYARAAAVIEAEIHKLQKKNLIIYFICTFEESSLWQQHPYLFPCYPGSCGQNFYTYACHQQNGKSFLFSLAQATSLSPCVYPAFSAFPPLMLIKAHKLRKLSCIVPRRRIPSLRSKLSVQQNPIKHKNKINCDIFQLAQRIVVSTIGTHTKSSELLIFHDSYIHMY